MLKGTTLIHPEISKPIHFTNTGIKEALNQPHKHLDAKNEAILQIEDHIKNGKYLGSIGDGKGRQFKFHYIETEIEGCPSVIVLRENKDGVYFYSITEKKGR